MLGRRRRIVEACRRVVAAWRVLRHGVPPATPDHRGVAEAAAIEQLRSYLEPCFAGVGLPYWWPTVATSNELRSLKVAVDVADGVRGLDWAQIEAGGWPR